MRADGRVITTGIGKSKKMENKCRKKGVSSVLYSRDAERQRDLMEFEIADKITGLARLLDISVSELRELFAAT